MPFSVVMPALEMAQETGKLIAWRRKEGDFVSKGEPLLEIETDKAVVEVEAPADGILAGINASVGSDIPVGQTIAWIVAPGEEIPIDIASTPAARAGSQPKTDSPPVTRTPLAGASPGSSPSAKVSPKARRLAKELGIDLATVRGSGPGEEILASDVQAAVASTSVADKSSGNLEVPGSIGRITAERTTQSWTSVPHFYVSRELDATALNEYRNSRVTELESAHHVRVTHTDLLVALVARVLLKHPRLNASWSREGIHLHDHVHMGVAIAVDDGVVAAVIPNVHAASLAEIAMQRRDVADRARAGKLRPADIADATFTISNLGMYQVDHFSAIITPPQAAILAVGSIAERVVALEGKPVVRPTMILTLSCDHRIADGARAAFFLADVAHALQEPESWLK